MHVIDVTDGLRKVPEIVPLGEARELRTVVQPYIDQTLDPAFPSRVKNTSADFLVNPIVKIFTRPRPSLSYYPQLG